MAPQAGDEVEVWDWHLPALRAWPAVAGQWAVAALGGLGGARLLWLGLDAARVKAALEMAGVAPDEALWEMLQTMAEGAAEELNR